MSVACVVDASVGIKLFLVEPLTEEADALFERAVADPDARLYVPDLFYIECANILAKYARWHDYPVQSALRDLQDLVRLPLTSVPTQEISVSALSLALTHGVSAYDGAYVALAGMLSVPLVTADDALVRRLAGTGLDVRLLGEWPPPLAVGVQV